MAWKDKFVTTTGGGGSAGGGIEAALRPGEDLLGTLMATRRVGLIPKTVTVGVTRDRLLLATVGAKAGDDIVSVERDDITGSSAKGLGTDWRKLAGDNVAKVVIQSRTHGEIKLSVLGDDLAERAVTGGPSSGVAALQEFLAAIG